MKKLIIEFDEREIDEIMVVEAIKGFELPWVKNLYLKENKMQK